MQMYHNRTNMIVHQDDQDLHQPDITAFERQQHRISTIKPQTKLLKNHDTITWSREAQNAFDQIKCIRYSKAIWKPLDVKNLFVLTVNTQNVVTGAVLVKMKILIPESHSRPKPKPPFEN